MIITESSRLVLRVVKLDDAPLMLTLMNEPAYLENIGDKQIRTLDDAGHYLKSGPLAMQQELGFSLYCIERKDTGQAIGLSGLIKRPGVEHPEVGYAILTEHCRQGFGLESVEAVIKHAREQLNLPVLQAITSVDNSASVNLLKRLAFNFQGLITLPGSDEEINLFERKLA
ncbi:GNAT family N-acetyltransferase [Thalassomonas actiniarum]|uniref:GNAT family N-acetyltransferase n=1 Tax=Thalassomonas actiniarum TaxID=485447 RepID=A0AAF0C2Q4_9GAMM|nr:GNAT family N-acetyltransferase [Thalassomonas actiniarum]WDD98095.1 GNAT family N-acetyltransferase [Thalassomonas actiniarum]